MDGGLDAISSTLDAGRVGGLISNSCACLFLYQLVFFLDVMDDTFLSLLIYIIFYSLDSVRFIKECFFSFFSLFSIHYVKLTLFYLRNWWLKSSHSVLKFSMSVSLTYFFCFLSILFFFSPRARTFSSLVSNSFS